jgi:ABC-type antimicrobial peptide transport system permease subunit
MLLTTLGVLGMILAATGIYGVVSYFVNLRTKEIGVRIALGASATSVFALMGRQALMPVFAGLAIGVAASLAATKLLAASLYQVSPTDPITFACVVAGLLFVAVLAAVGPARRASRVPPTQALG